MSCLPCSGMSASVQTITTSLWMVLLMGLKSLREYIFFSMGWQLALQIRGQVLFDFVLLFFVWPHMNSTADLYAMSKQIKVSTVVSALSHNIIVTSDWAWRNNGEHIYKGPISDMSPWSVLLQHHETIDRDIMKEQSVKSNNHYPLCDRTSKGKTNIKGSMEKWGFLPFNTIIKTIHLKVRNLNCH